MALIGIDLGTTNSLAGVWTQDGVTLIPNAFGEKLTPSVVSFDESGQVYVGKIAKERLITDPQNTYAEFKRMMGTTQTVYSQSMKREYRPEELSALVLKQLKEDAEHFLGEPVTEAVISVPAYFNDRQRSATREAGQLAGITVERLINEPSAASLAYHTKQNSDSATYIVYDFGGGTLDVSVVEAFDNIVEIQSVSGDNHLGGKDFNDEIVRDFISTNDINLSKLSKKDYQIIYREAEAVKIELSKKSEVYHTFYLSGKQYEMKMTNQHLVSISTILLERMVTPLRKVMNDLSLEYEDIDMLILVGGSSKMPVVQQFLQSLFPIQICNDINVDEIVGVGAATVAGMKQRRTEIKDMILSDICPFSLGVEILGGVMSNIIERNASLPISCESVYSTARDNQTFIKLSIYQGEHIEAKQNLLIDEIEIRIPKRPKGEVPVYVRFSYDINGIFDIDISSPYADIDIHKSIVNEHSGLSKQDIEHKKKELAALKIASREKTENRMLLSMAERLCEECNESQRNQIRIAAQQFLDVIESSNQKEVRTGRVRFSLFLAMVEKSMRTIAVDTNTFWNEEEFNKQLQSQLERENIDDNP